MAASAERIFTVRMWVEGDGDEAEVRGSVRDLATGANRRFRRLADLTRFMRDQVLDRPHDEGRRR